MSEEIENAFKDLIKDIQGSYQDWEDLCTILKKAKVDDKHIKIAKKIFDQERRKK